jgi:hypothetical protein
MLAWAQMPPVTDADLKFNAVPGQPGAPAAILFREEIYDDVHNHSASYQQRIKILTEEGRKYADIVIPYDRKNLPIIGVSGRTIHPDGKIIPFEGKPFDKVIYKGKHTRYNVKSFTLPDVQVGSIIEFKYTKIYADHAMYAPQWLVQEELWQKQAHFRFYMFQGDLVDEHEQIARGVAWTVNLPKGMETKQVELPNREIYIQLEASNIPSFVEEPYMPDSEQFRYNVHFYYQIANKREDFWKNQAKFWDKDASKFMGKRNGIAEAVGQITTASDAPEQKVRKIYAFVSGLDNERYVTSLSEQEVKTLGLKEVKGVEDVLRQKRGNPEELTRLFVAMVREAGIPAYLMVVTNRENNVYDPNYMDFRQLDDEIAVVQTDGKDVYLDPGAKFSPYGLLDWRHTNTSGFRQSPDKPQLVTTPNPSYKDAMLQRVARFTIQPDYSVSGPMRVAFMGFLATSRRQAAAKGDDEARKKDLEDEVKSWLPAESEVKLTNVPNWKDIEKPLMAEFRVSAPIASNAGKRILFPAQAFHFLQKPMFPHSERVNGIYLYYPSREMDDVTLTVPASMALESMPKKETVQLDYAIYNAEYSGKGQTISIMRDLAINAYVFPREKYPEVKGFYDKVKAGDEQQLILRSTANAAAGN